MVVLAASACAGERGDGRPLARRVPATVEAPATTATTSTTEVPSTESTTTTLLGGATLVLGPLGLGELVFGMEAAEVLAVVRAVLGPASDDNSLGSCPSGEIDRVVDFGELSVLLATTSGTERFVGWELGPASGALPRLATAEGISLGSSLAELRAAYGARLRLAAEDPFGTAFAVEVEPPGRLEGTLTGAAAGDIVASLSGGAATCALDD